MTIHRSANSPIFLCRPSKLNNPFRPLGPMQLQGLKLVKLFALWLSSERNQLILSHFEPQSLPWQSIKLTALSLRFICFCEFVEFQLHHLRALPGLLFRLICCVFFSNVRCSKTFDNDSACFFLSFFYNNSLFLASESEVLKDPFSASLDAATSDLAGKETSQLEN